MDAPKAPGPAELYCTDAEWRDAILFCGRWPAPAAAASGVASFDVSDADARDRAVKFQLGTDAAPLVVEGFAADPAGGGVCLLARAPDAYAAIVATLRARFEKAHAKKYVGKGRRLRKRLTRGTPLTADGGKTVCLRAPSDRAGAGDWDSLRAGDRAVIRVVFGGWASAGVVSSASVRVLDARKIAP